MAFKVTSFSDPNFLKLGIFCIATGCILAAILMVIDAPWWVALRGGLGIGLLIVIAHYAAVYHKKQGKKE